MNRIVKLPAIFSGVRSRKDRSYNLQFDTRELSGTDAALLLGLQQTEGYLLFAATNDVDDKDIPEGKADAGLGKKTSSQRLRGVLYVLWEQSGGRGDFEDFYRAKMEMFIDIVKDKLDKGAS